MLMLFNIYYIVKAISLKIYSCGSTTALCTKSGALSLSSGFTRLKSKHNFAGLK